MVLQCSTAPNRDREGPHGLPPPTPPDGRVTYPAVRRVESLRRGQAAASARVEARGGTRETQRRALPETPGSVGRGGGVPGERSADAAAASCPIAGPPPRRPPRAAESAAQPRVTLATPRRCVTQATGAVPASPGAGHLRHPRLEPAAPGTRRTRPTPRRAPLHRLWRSPARWGAGSRTANTPPLTRPRSGSGACRVVHDPREPSGDDPREALPPPRTRSQAPHGAMALVGVPDTAGPTSFTCLLPFVQPQVRYKGRPGPALRGPLVGRADQAAFAHARLPQSTHTLPPARILPSLGTCSPPCLVGHPVTDLLPVTLPHPAIALGDIRLGLCPRVGCCTVGTDPVAVGRTRRVPWGVPPLHPRVLDDTGAPCRETTRSDAALGRGSLDPCHRVRCLRAAAPRLPDGWPLVCERLRSLPHRPALDARAPLGRLPALQGALQVLARNHLFPDAFVTHRAFRPERCPGGFRPVCGRRRGVTPPVCRTGPAHLVFLRRGSHDTPRLLTPPLHPVRGPFGPSPDVSSRSDALG